MSKTMEKPGQAALEKRALELRTLIAFHDEHYYTAGRPLIADHEYDTLMRELVELETAHPELRIATSPTQRVGGKPVPGMVQVRHKRPMLSIENVYDEAQLNKWLDGLEAAINQPILYAAEFKVDGIAIAITYDYEFSKAVTRGDGHVGDDVTHNVRTAHGVPMLRDQVDSDEFEIRGELFIGHHDFANIKAEQLRNGEQAYVNSRGAAAGALRLLDPQETAKRHLRFMAYGGDCPEGCTTHSQMMRRFQEIGFPRIPYYGESLDRVELFRHLDYMIEKMPSLDFPVDGIVIKVEHFAQHELIGATSKAPRWAIAYKWERYEATTRVNAITLQVGRTGTITPVAELEPVVIAETTVTRSTLFNFNEVARLDVRVGDTVVVEKAGKIIPHIVSVDLANSPPRSEAPELVTAPSSCPVCGAQVVVDSNVAVRCSSSDCPQVLQGSLEHFASRGGMDIEGMGPSIIEQLLASKLVTKFADIFTLHEKKEQLLQLEGVGKKKMEKLLAGIEACKQKPLAKVLYALGIQHVGEGTSERLVRHFGTLEEVSRATEDQLRQIPDLGERSAISIVNFFREVGTQDLLELFEELGMACMKKPASEGEKILAGLTIVVTGTLQNFDRNAIKDTIRAKGGIVSDSVTKKTSFVLVGENAGSKATKAADLGIPTMTEDQFMNLLSGGANNG